MLFRSAFIGHIDEDLGVRIGIPEFGDLSFKGESPGVVIRDIGSVMSGDRDGESGMASPRVTNITTAILFFINRASSGMMKVNVRFLYSRSAISSSNLSLTHQSMKRIIRPNGRFK